MSVAKQRIKAPIEPSPMSVVLTRLEARNRLAYYSTIYDAAFHVHCNFGWIINIRLKGITIGFFRLERESSPGTAGREALYRYTAI